MSLRRAIYRIVFAGAILTALLALGLVGAMWYAPVYLEEHLIPRLSKSLGDLPVSARIRHVGLFGAEAADLRFGQNRQPGVSVSSMRIDYTPAGLAKKEIERITLSGLELYCRYRQGTLGFRGFDFERLLNSLESGSAPGAERKTAADASSLPVERIEIQNAVLHMDLNGFPLQIPFDFLLEPDPQHPNNRAFRLRMSPEGQVLALAGRLLIDEKRVQLSLDADGLEIRRVEGWIRPVPALQLSGRADITGDAVVQISPFEIVSAGFEARLTDGRIGYGALEWRLPDSGAEAKPFRLHIEQQHPGLWALRANGVRLTRPAALALTGISSQVATTPQGIAASGEFRFSAAPQEFASSLQAALKTPLEQTLRFHFQRQKGGDWEFKIDAPPEPEKTPSTGSPLRIDTRYGGVLFAIPAFTATAGGNGRHAAGDLEITLRSLHMQPDTIKLQLPVLNISASAQGDFSDSGAVSAKLIATASGLNIDSGRINARIPTAILDAALDGSTRDGWRYRGDLKASRVRLKSDSLQLAAADINASLPLQWPPAREPEPGRIRVETVTWKAKSLGGIEATVRQTTTGLHISGHHRNRLVAGLNAEFDGELETGAENGTRMRLQVDIDPFVLGKDIDWKTLLPGMDDDLTLSGRIEAHGGLRLDGGKLTSGMRVAVSDGAMTLQSRQASVNGLTLDVTFDDLLVPTTRPRQTINFESARYGGLQFDQGWVEFRIESAQSLFIEKSRLKWCGGTVDTQAMRIDPKVQDYELVLFCDRLNLTRILTQLGLSGAHGSGEVSGRIPVYYRNHAIGFHDGVLFSTPGQGGKIRLTGTEALTAAIPEGTPQFVQLELAREALKDYDYEWIKLVLTTEGETLKLKMQMDGKPVGELPFVYKKEIGGFAKVEAGSRGSVFQGIRLDVNFNLPLNEILRYGEGVKKVMEMTR